ncbi:MAG: ester cyclase [Proteobacteria bacterium]|nr:ester cyclase [Pseudomonadota bacterium]
MVDEAIRTVLARHLQAENAHDMEGTLTTLHPDCVFEEVPLGRVFHGREGAREHYDYWWRTFDLHFEESVANHWCEDGSLVAEGVFGGVHKGPFLGIEAPGTSVKYPFLVIVEFRDGLLSREKFYFDLKGIESQIRGA